MKSLFKHAAALAFTTILTFGLGDGVLFNTPEAVAQEANTFELSQFIVNESIVTGAAGPEIGKIFAAIENPLLESLENEIRMEEGKSTDQFFAIKKCLKPCLKSPSTCYDDMADYYHESVFKLMRASVQLNALATTLIVMSNAKIENGRSFDELAVYFAVGITAKIFNLVNTNMELFNKFTKPIAELSPVGRKILNSELDFKSKQRLIGIWMMRQIPYAVEDVFKTYNQNGLTLTIKDLDPKRIEDNTINYLNALTYDSKPANIDWRKYTKQKKH